MPLTISNTDSDKCSIVNTDSFDSSMLFLKVSFPLKFTYANLADSSLASLPKSDPGYNATPVSSSNCLHRVFESQIFLSFNISSNG